MLPELQAERQLNAIEAASVPHFDGASRRDTFAKYASVLDADKQPERATAASLAAVGIAVVEFVQEGGE